MTIDEKKLTIHVGNAKTLAEWQELSDKVGREVETRAIHS